VEAVEGFLGGWERGIGHGHTATFSGVTSSSGHGFSR
jgi:hypothetical protein